jgi:RHS repeat-associated protein
MAAKYATDRPIVRLRDTDGDGIYDEKLSYIQNWRGDVVALVKRVAKLDAMTADAAKREILDPKQELPESAQVTFPITSTTWTGTDPVSTAIRAALERQGYKLSVLEAAGGTTLPPLDVPGRGMVVERYSYGLYGDPDTQAFVDTARTNLLVSQDAIDEHAQVFGACIDYIGTDGLRGDLRADVDGDGMISSWDQLRFAQQQTAWTLINFEQIAANSDEPIDGWSTLGQLSRPHPVGMKPTGELLEAGTNGVPGPRELYKLRGVVQLDNRLGYAGYVWDPFLQMYHVRHRVFNPRLGIWIQPDPIGYAGGWNLHEYCNGDPLNFVDPMGLEGIGIWDLLGGVAANLGNWRSGAAVTNQPGLPKKTIEAYRLAAADANGRQGSADAAIIQRGRDVESFRDAMPLVAAAAEGVVLFTIAPGLNIQSGFAEGLNLVKGAKVIKEGEKTFVLAADGRKVQVTAERAERVIAAARAADSKAAATGVKAADVAACGGTGAATHGAKDGKAIAVIGRLEDTKIAKEWPGHQVLDIANWDIKKNDAWINNIIQQRQTVYVGSPKTPATLWDTAHQRQTVFARELQQLKDAGYRQVGDYLYPPAAK